MVSVLLLLCLLPTHSPKWHLLVPAVPMGDGAPWLLHALWFIMPQALPGKRKLAARARHPVATALSLVVIYYLLDGPERTI